MRPLYFKVIKELLDDPLQSQRKLSKSISLSLSYTNKILSEMTNEGLISKTQTGTFITEEGRNQYFSCKVDNAVILAAGFGSRFVPITYATPKGLLEVFGEPMIERQIRQLHEAGITDITIVVGYLKDMFEYLIDKYNVKLIFNPDYSKKNNISSLFYARHELKNTYILSSDNWLRQNIYRAYESDSWYSAVFSLIHTKEWCMSIDRHDKICSVSLGGINKWFMYGPVYFSSSFSKTIVPLVEEAYTKPECDSWYWEDILIRNLDKLPIYINRQSENQIYEFESLDELRQFDKSYKSETGNQYIKLIAQIFDTSENEITNFKPLCYGMTNKSFLFEIHDKKYIFRLPGEGTEQLIDRNQEFEAYKAIECLNICDKTEYLDPKTGYKITRFELNARNANKDKKEDVERCMEVARKLHTSNVSISYTFDFREKINFYEKLAQNYHGILFADYAAIRKEMDKILDWIEKRNPQKALTHIDLVPDNFIISGIAEHKIQLIDWEYASMCDPLVDIAMFAIYSYYSEDELKSLIKTYFQRDPTNDEELRIYCYVALGGFLWSLWTCYKQSLGNEFGEYGLKMYRYAKDYFKKVEGRI